MMGAANPQRGLFYNISLETFVPEEHPLRRIGTGCVASGGAGCSASGRRRI
jgi:hypothetical protein